MTGVVRFSISLPPSLVRDFDESWKDMGYSSRSKAAHDAFRNFIRDYRLSRDKSEEIAGTIVMLYYLDRPGLLNQIVDAQHKFESIVVSSMHVHVSEDKCLEIIAVKGKAKDVNSLSQELSIKKGVKELKFTALAL